MAVVGFQEAESLDLRTEMKPPMNPRSDERILSTAPPEFLPRNLPLFCCGKLVHPAAGEVRAFPGSLKHLETVILFDLRES